MRIEQEDEEDQATRMENLALFEDMRYYYHQYGEEDSAAPPPHDLCTTTAPLPPPHISFCCCCQNCMHGMICFEITIT